MRWRNSSGVGTIISNDPWLPTPHSLKPVSLLDEDCKHQLVAALIIEESNSWNVNLVKSLFLYHEASTILHLPLSRQGAEDKLVWHWSKNGDFTVKSAYHQAVDLLETKTESHSTKGEILSHNKVPWEKICKLDMPNKVKFFLWKACKSILPTNASL